MVVKLLTGIFRRRQEKREAFDALADADRMSLEEREALSERFSDMLTGAPDAAPPPAPAQPDQRSELLPDPDPVPEPEPKVDFDAWSRGESVPSETPPEGEDKPG